MCTVVPCKMIDDVIVLNEWIFNCPQSIDCISSTFVCARSCGLNDYHAEWRRDIDTRKFKLFITRYHLGITETESIESVRTVDTIGEVILYCACNRHPIAADLGL